MKDAAREKLSTTPSASRRWVASMYWCTPLCANMPSKMTIEAPAAMELTKKNMGMKGEYQSGCSFSGAMR